MRKRPGGRAARLEASEQSSNLTITVWIWRNGEGRILKEEHAKNVVKVNRVLDRVMSMKLETEGTMMYFINGCAPQVSCQMEEKEQFWGRLDDMVENIPR